MHKSTRRCDLTELSPGSNARLTAATRARAYDGFARNLVLIAAPPLARDAERAFSTKMPNDHHWYLVSSHGSVLFFIAANPDCRIGDIADGMSLTHRTVWGIVGDLRRAGMLQVRRSGRHHHYSVDLEGPFPHPTISGLRLGRVLGRIANGHEDTEPTQA